MCKGTNEVHRHRCPHVEAKGCGDLIRSAFDFTEQGVLPGPGSMNDQAAWWVDALRVAQVERGLIERAQRDEMLREQ